MARPDLAEKDILNPSEAIEYFVLSRRKFYDLLNNTDGVDFLAYYGERKLILRVAFEKYLLAPSRAEEARLMAKAEEDRQDGIPKEESSDRERA